ncbi:MAG: hydrophobe/amphiphile efflux-1 family RND transporter [Candidatus Meridianibacter frigidus]|nr:MAG: hydrophobe/amphiphile efflux-1 family RND transporter [Candidatus Eremiobacteraeota bacterium]
MRLNNFFINRPVFAIVCSAIILLIGLVSIPTLPIAEYPKIAPPVVTVNAYYTGASAETVETGVTTPLEQAINGVQGLRYIQSTSANNGQSQITCTFNLGVDLDQAANDVQNAVNAALGRLPNEVKQTGVTVSKNSGSFTMALALTSTNPKYDSLFLSNYADLQITNALKRVPGVGNILIFGERKYAMRLWLDPVKLSQYRLSAGDVISALQEQNVQVAAGSLGAAPAPANQQYTLSVRAVGRLSTPQQFADMILRADPDGGFVRLSQVGRVELGAEDYASQLFYSGRTAIGLGVLQLSTANALQLSQGVRSAMTELAKKFPPGVTWSVGFDTADFVNESIREVLITLLIAILLVVIVIFLFLQNWRTTLVPFITIPISLIGTFGLMKFFGFSINTLTLFGLTLATGLVVDDAIVVIENISRFVEDKSEESHRAAADAMREITGAVVATSLVLLAVFVPVAFFPGTTGQLYKQFALTIACSITISAFNALTLTPALAALFLSKGVQRPGGSFFNAVNGMIAATRAAYHRGLPTVLTRKPFWVGLFAVGMLATFLLFRSTPTAFIPDEDQGFFIVTVQTPEGSAIGKTVTVLKRVQTLLDQQPEVSASFAVAGFSFGGSGPSRGIMFIRLKPWGERGGNDHTLNSVLGRLRGPLFMIPNAQVFAFNPPPVQGVGTIGGFQYELEDQGNVGMPALMGTAFGYMRVANQDPALTSVFTTFRLNSPQVVVNVDRGKALALHVPLANIFSTLQVDLGSAYVNDFDYLNRSYRVYVQAEAPYRANVGNLNQLYVRNANGDVMPLTQLVSVSEEKTAPIIDHYNLYRSIELNGTAAGGHGSGQAISAMQQLAERLNPPGVGYEWSGLSLDEIQSGNQTLIIFFLGIVFVFLVLSAKYESFTDPLVILLAVPLAILGALLGLRVRGLQSDVFAQVGYVMLVGLASKNGILIVEFANQLRARGADIVSAVITAAETRLRPILMTSLAFTLGVFPLVLATGAGSAARRSLGTAVFGGMIVSTLLSLFIIPVLYVIIEVAKERARRPRGETAPGNSKLTR